LTIALLLVLGEVRGGRAGSLLLVARATARQDDDAREDEDHLSQRHTPGGVRSAKLVRSDDRDVGVLHDRAVDFLAEAGRAGHCLWYQVLPSLTWLPFLRMRRLHFGQVPICEPFSFTRVRYRAARYGRVL
jgi:hypothetical protein